MKFYLEIQRSAGIDRRDITPGAHFGTVEGACPDCGSELFRVQGVASRLDAQTMRSGGVALCCGSHVGWIFAETETIFGKEEDDAVLVHGRARVYGGGTRA